MSSTDLSDARWRTSSYSNGQANCVQAARAGHGNGLALVAVRDSKAPAGTVLAFGPAAWRRFTAT